MNAALGEDLRIEVRGAAADLPPAWDGLVAGADPILRRPLLSAMAQAPPPGTRQRFALAWRGHGLAAAAVFHVVPLQVGRLGRWAAEAPWPARLFFGLIGLLGRLRRPHLLLCGDLLHSDAPGACFDAQVADPAGVLHRMAEAVRGALAERVGLVVFKAPDLGPPAAALPALGYHRVGAAQPTMRLAVDPGWRGWPGYLDAMRSKYRQRARAARRRLPPVTREALDAAGIAACGPALDALLAPVIEGAEVALAPAPWQTLAALKAHLGEDLRVVLYRLPGRPVGFSVSLRRPGALEAMLVGVEPAANRRHKLYQNALYDFVEQAMADGLPRVDLGRTALEIKSAVGAEPHHFDIFVRHPARLLHGRLLHALLGFAAGRLRPPDWTPRHPFG